MKNKWIVLIADIETGEWSLAINTADTKVKDEFIKSIEDTDDPTPYIAIWTGDYAWTH